MKSIIENYLEIIKCRSIFNLNLFYGSHLKDCFLKNSFGQLSLEEEIVGNDKLQESMVHIKLEKIEK